MSRWPCAILLSLFAILGTAEPGLPATLLVSSTGTAPAGSPLLCTTSEDADFQYRWGRLDPKSGLFSYYHPDQSPLSPQIVMPREASPGDLLKVEILEAESVDSISARVLGPKQEPVAGGTGFHASESAHGDRWVVLVGISSLVAKGFYQLSVEVKSGDRTAMQLSQLSVQERTFRYERIVLTAGLTQLRTSEDSRK
ncbi:MAG TPA: hypothetical protein VMU36_06620, partial [Spirochaetia bacterium]|nr:hypothetical protein [Spirochaetia bacterium]